MVAPLNKNKMSPEDRLNYLYNELEQLHIKQQRYERDKIRPKDDIAFYIKCNEHFLQRIKEEIKQLESKNGA